MSKFFKFKAEVVPGKCPTCEEHTLLVGLTKEYYRCMTCGADLEQHINGKISYIPAMHLNTLKSDLDTYFGDGENLRIFKQGCTRTCVSQNEYRS